MFFFQTLYVPLSFITHSLSYHLLGIRIFRIEVRYKDNIGILFRKIFLYVSQVGKNYRINKSIIFILMLGMNLCSKHYGAVHGTVYLQRKPQDTR
jgi:hypothetical protein